MNTNKNVALVRKQHFEILDGLRGIAAFAIVVFHFMEWIYPNPSENFIGHGFLAVDFFFCLSGFVIAYAYDDRIAKMGTVEFFKSRLIRLHPLVILGAILGLIGFLWDPFSDASSTYSFSRIAWLFICSLLLIPMPTMEDRFFNNFGLNAPAWSLFWEYVANIFYAFVLYRLNKRVLIVVLIVAAGLLLYIAQLRGNLLGGWSHDNFWEGGVRIAYSFTAGLLIFRYRLIIKNRLGFGILTILLSCAFLMPYFPLNWLVEALIVMLYFPLIVALGAGSVLSVNMRPICKFSGDISYPMYMTHYWIIWIFGNYLTMYKPAGFNLALIVVAGTLVILVVAYLAMRLYDIPVRRYLTARRKVSLQQ